MVKEVYYLIFVILEYRTDLRNPDGLRSAALSIAHRDVLVEITILAHLEAVLENGAGSIPSF